MNDPANVLWTLIFAAAIAWLIYYFAWQRGYSIGYQEGEEAGRQQGKAEGIQAGLHESVKARVLRDLKGSEAVWLMEDEKAIREAFYAKLTEKPPTPEPPPSFLEELLDVVQKLAWWAFFTAIVALMVYLKK